MVVNSVRDQLDRGNSVPLSLFAPENLESGYVFGHSARSPYSFCILSGVYSRRPYITSSTPVPVPVFEVTQWRTDGFLQDSTGGGPVVLKVA